jgi:uncharacterized repeat protein (TIGR01451 family)
MRLASRLVLAFVALLFLIAAPAAAQVVINEIDYDQIGTDAAEFVELKNTSGGIVNLDNYTLELVNGTGGGAAIYDTINLPNVNLAAGDYYVICANAATVPNCDLDDGPDTDFVQNGSPDAVGLRLSGTLVDAVSYEGNSGAPYTETTGVPNVAASSDSNTVAFIGLSRFPDGADSNNNSADLSIRCITPGVTNTSASTSCSPPPVLPNLTINDVSLNEGNAGTTTFTFTVSLSAPAGPGGVTFDISTADGTAQDDSPVAEDNDYVARSLTGQTIPSGSSTYTFDVMVNGDTTPETNETFFINVTNVTGATVTDGQGQGTIQNDDSPNLTINDVSLNEGNAGTTTFTFTVSLSAPAGPGGVTFDISTADGTAQDDNPVAEDNDYVAKSLTGQTIPSGSSTYTFDVTVNGDTAPEASETFFVNVTNVVNAIGTDTQGQGTIVNDDITRIHDVQGPGAATPIPGATVTVEGVVIGDYQAGTQLQGFFLQEEDADADADPATSEGIFIFCSSCPTPVAEGQRVRVTGSASEFFNMTEITASTAPAVVVTEAGNHLAEVTPTPIDLPVVGVINDFYEAREGMRVTFVDTLTVAEYFELFRFGHIELFEGGRPRQFTEMSPPSVAGNAAHLDNLDRRRVILDDTDNTPNAPLNLPDGSQFVFHPRTNGGFSVGTQGTDFFRGGDLVNGLTGVLHWDFAGSGSVNAWRIRPTTATPVTFTVANPRPATPPAVGGAIKVVGMNLLNYFTTIDTTASTSAGPCAPSGTLDCRGADSVAELNRQRERASVVVCALNADVFGFAELENTTASATITDLLGAINARCGGAHPYDFVNTGGTLGTDAIRVQLIYRTGIVSLTGSPLSDLDPVHNRPPTAQTFNVVDPANTAFGQRFTVVINHFKSKGCPGSGGDADAGDGQGCFNATRVAQANRLLTWINSTVLPNPSGAFGDPDVLLLGDFNSYAQEDPVTTIEAGGYSDLETVFHGANAYSFLFDGQLGHLDYAFSSVGLTPQVTGADVWHINADEVPLFDYNDEVFDSPGEANFEEKPDGSALAPPRVVFQPASPYRAADHDPVIVGLFPIADVSITKTDGVTTAVPGGSVTYTITASNAGPDPVTGGVVADTFPAILTCTWTCVGAGGGTCTAAGSGNISDGVTLPVGGSVTYTASCTIAASALGTLSNTAMVSGVAAGDPNQGSNSATDTDTLTPQADLAVTKTDGVTTATPGGSVTYTIMASNAGPSDAPGSTVTDTFPGVLTCTWTCVGAGGGTCTAAGSGNISDTVNLPAGGSVTYTASCTISPSATGSLVNTATVEESEGVTDPNPDNNSATDTDGLGATADLAITKTDGVTTATPGGSVTYTITASNAGPSDSDGASVVDTFPTELTCTWTCAGAGGGTCNASGAGNISEAVFLPAGGSVTYTVPCTVSPAASGTISNTATVNMMQGGPTDPNPDNNSATDTDTLGATADLAITKTDGVTSVTAGGSVTYTITASNAGPSDVTGATVTDTFPASLTCTWTCVGAGGGTCTAAGSGNISDTVNLPAGGSVTYTASCTLSSSATGTLSNTATVAAPGGVTDPNPDNNSATDTDTVTASAMASLTGTKSAGGSFTPGSTVTYTVVLSNSGPGTQGDNPGNEFTDVLPAGLTLVSATATSGTATAAVATNTVTWNGSIAADGSVTITITATINSAVPPGTTISNQGSFAFDADGDGINEASGTTDNPATEPPGDPTSFQVAQQADLLEIPTLDTVGLALLALLLAIGGAWSLRRKRNA